MSETTSQEASAVALASEYVVTFERVGRRRDVGSLSVAGSDADEIAYRIYMYARQFIASKDVEVAVDLEKMRGWINFGRFGEFTLTAVDATTSVVPQDDAPKNGPPAAAVSTADHAAGEPE